MPEIEVVTLAARNDNYVYIVAFDGAAVVVDPGEAKCVLEYVRERSLRLTHVLVTHHHLDHTGGISAIVEASGAQVVGSNDRRIPLLSVRVDDGQRLEAAGMQWRIMATPGHTLSDTSYVCEGIPAVFTGDTMFLGGCGRLFEGSAAQMWASLRALASLPASTRVYCGHEYTLENAEFACHVEPDDPAYRARLERVRGLRARGEPTVPGSIADERAANIFVRAPDAETYAQLRRRKDRF
jgi:hydroxyacylglutathione hydrolase